MAQRWSRRSFVGFTSGLSAVGVSLSTARAWGQSPTAVTSVTSEMFPSQEPALAREIVGVSHRDLKRVQELVELNIVLHLGTLGSILVWHWFVLFVGVMEQSWSFGHPWDWINALLGSVGAWLIVRGLRSAIRTQPGPGACSECGYNLGTLSRCPECGHNSGDPS